MKFAGQLNPGDVLEIDMKLQTVKVNGQNVLDKTTGSFFKLLVGTNTITYSDESANRNISMEITRTTKFF